MPITSIISVSIITAFFLVMLNLSINEAIIDSITDTELVRAAKNTMIKNTPPKIKPPVPNDENTFGSDSNRRDGPDAFIPSRPWVT